MRTPELTQYLNLVKCNWILQRMKESLPLAQESLWQRCLEDIETVCSDTQYQMVYLSIHAQGLISTRISLVSMESLIWASFTPRVRM